MAAFALLLGLVIVPGARADVPPGPLDATVSGPIPSDRVGSSTRNYPFAAALQDLSVYGYVEQEFFFSGTTPFGSYASRMLVRRPADPKRYSGTVIADWQNVSNSFDLECLWTRSGEHVMRSGDAYVSIDAQTLGVQGAPHSLKSWSPKRYASLHLPTSGTFVAEGGAYLIFDQALRALRMPTTVDPLHGFGTKQLIATGCSQSAGTVEIYSTTIGPATRYADGYLLSTLSTKSTQTSPAPPLNYPDPTPGATGDVPVFQVNTESDPTTVRQPDSSTYRLWEVAGASHADFDAQDYVEAYARRDLHINLGPYHCGVNPLSRIHFAHVQNAALEGLKTWVRTGQPPPTEPFFQTDATGSIQRDGRGLALGGIRLPEFAVPTAQNSALNTGPDFCVRLAGRSVPFSASTLHALYPSHQAYVGKVERATATAVAAGVLLPEDVTQTLVAARAANIPPAAPAAPAAAPPENGVRPGSPTARGLAVTGAAAAVPSLALAAVALGALLLRARRDLFRTTP